MKVLLLTLVTLLLCSTQVLTLQCYTCEGDTDHICKTKTTCQSSSMYCKTYVKDDDFSRSCEEFCQDDFFTTCCQEDLC